MKWKMKMIDLVTDEHGEQYNIKFHSTKLSRKYKTIIVAYILDYFYS